MPIARLSDRFFEVSNLSDSREAQKMRISVNKSNTNLKLLMNGVNGLKESVFVCNRSEDIWCVCVCVYIQASAQMRTPTNVRYAI